MCKISDVETKDIVIDQNLSRLDVADLCNLWAAVDWHNGSSTGDPDRLLKAMHRSENVWLAWDSIGQLVGLLSSIDDGLNAYITFFLVHPEYQGKGIGTQLIECFKDTYSDFRWQVVTRKAHNYYKNHGFTGESHGITRNTIPVGDIIKTGGRK